MVARAKSGLKLFLKKFLHHFHHVSMDARAKRGARSRRSNITATNILEWEPGSYSPHTLHYRRRYTATRELDTCRRTDWSHCTLDASNVAALRGETRRARPNQLRQPRNETVLSTTQGDVRQQSKRWSVERRFVYDSRNGFNRKRGHLCCLTYSTPLHSVPLHLTPLRSCRWNHIAG